MEILFKRFSLHKKASTFVEYQDATFPQGRDYSEPWIESYQSDDEFRCALADGATDAVFSKHWAELLVAGYAANEWTESTISSASLACIKERWHSHVAVKELPWYTLEKAKLGAAAALVTLRISAEGRRWSGVAIGDSCLFHIRNGAVITRFPEMSTSDFSNICELLSSSKDANNLELVRRVHENDSWLPGDYFYLMSDALACWFTRQLEEGKQRQAISLVSRMKSQEGFHRFVSAERERLLESGSKSLHDDDTTLIIVGIMDGAPVPRNKIVPQLEPTRFTRPWRIPVEMDSNMRTMVLVMVTACTTALIVLGTLTVSGWIHNPTKNLTKTDTQSNQPGVSKRKSVNDQSKSKSKATAKIKSDSASIVSKNEATEEAETVSDEETVAVDVSAKDARGTDSAHDEELGEHEQTASAKNKVQQSKQSASKHKVSKQSVKQDEHKVSPKSKRDPKPVDKQKVGHKRRGVLPSPSPSPSPTASSPGNSSICDSNSLYLIILFFTLYQKSDP